MTPRTLKDLVPILEVLNREIKFSRMFKGDLPQRNSIHKILTELLAIDIESIVIESISLDATGNVLANTLRNTLAEIIARVEDIRVVNPKADYGETPGEAFDKYEAEIFDGAVKRFLNKYLLYRDAMTLTERMKDFEEKRVKEADADKSKKEQLSMPSMPFITPGMTHEKIRQLYLKEKTRFLMSLQRSIEFEENLESNCRPKLRNVVEVCNKISRIISKYYPPCEITLPKMPTEFEEERKKAKSGTNANKGESDKDKKKQPKEMTPWEGDVFPMALTSELYEISKDFFHVQSEAAFHSALNLHYKYDPITAKKGHHNRVAYMVQQLYNLLPDHQCREWRDTFLDYVGVERSYYDSKSSNATSDDASKRSQRYVVVLDEVLKNHRKRA